MFKYANIEAKHFDGLSRMENISKGEKTRLENIIENENKEKA